jgi:large exoprotein involved in heme utilization and adhesion
LESSTLGTGNSGNVQVQARNRILISDGSAIGSQVDLETVGNGGDIDITAGSLSILSGGQIGTGIFGLGDAGSIRIRVSDRIFLNGFATIPNGEVSPSGVFSSVNQQAVGQGGNINITTASLIAANGAVVNSSTNGRGGAGDIRIIASDRISLTGQAGTTRTAIDSTIAPQAEGDGGNIQITTRSLSVSNGAGINASVSGIGDAGDIRIRASDRVSLIGEGVGGRTQPSIIRSDVEGRAIGTGGNISIDTGTLLIRNGGQLGAATFGRGNAGNVRIEADDRVLLSGSERTGYTAINTAVQTDAVGNAGSVEILTGILSVVNGAGIVVSTFGRGDGGDLRVEARDRITLNGEIRIADPSAPTGTSRAPSGLFSSVGNRYSRAAIGNTGEISITTDSLNVTDGALIATSSFGRGNAGDVNIEADRIILSGEGLSTRGSPRGILSRGEAGARGSGGDVEIEANSLSITDEAVLAASSFGRGSSGNIDASVSSIFLNNGRIEVENRSQSGGNITLRNIDTLLLRNGSGISATAGIDRAGGGDGGNITIDAENGFVVAVPQENSNITANAFSGSGGNVDLTIQGIFGIESQPAETPLSDITASSTFGVAGNVTIARPDVDPSRGLTELPADVTDASTQIAQTCATGSNVAQTQSEFVITGRGGLPDSPNDLRSSSAILTDLVTLNPFTEAESSAATVDRPAPTIVEAQGWIVGDRGEIQLVAQAPTVTPAHLASIAACNGS